MSFEVICGQCGAPSGPSVGVCPFCKAVLVRANGKGKDDHPTLKRIRELYEAGKLEDALALAAAAEKEAPKIASDTGFNLLYAKILVETEGPTSKIRALLTKASFEAGDDPEVKEYLELIEAKTKLSPQHDDLGEKALRALLTRSPRNFHALFLLGCHLFWVSRNANEAVSLLERCVELRPNFLRAWACLGAIYGKLGNAPLADRALQRCLALETNPQMRAYFERLLRQSLKAA